MVGFDECICRELRKMTDGQERPGPTLKGCDAWIGLIDEREIACFLFF